MVFTSIAHRFAPSSCERVGTRWCLRYICHHHQSHSSPTNKYHEHLRSFSRSGMDTLSSGMDVRGGIHGCFADARCWGGLNKVSPFLQMRRCRRRNGVNIRRNWEGDWIDGKVAAEEKTWCDLCCGGCHWVIKRSPLRFRLLWDCCPGYVDRPHIEQQGQVRV